MIGLLRSVTEPENLASPYKFLSVKHMPKPKSVMMIKLNLFKYLNINNRVCINVAYLNLYCTYERLFFHAKITLYNWHNMGCVSSPTNYIHVMFTISFPTNEVNY